jgi:hypothetical protein
MSTTKEKTYDSAMGPVTTREEGVVEHVHLGYNAHLTKNRSLISVLGMVSFAHESHIRDRH